MLKVETVTKSSEELSLETLLFKLIQDRNQMAYFCFYHLFIP